MMRLALDRNCLIDIEQDRPAAIYVKNLIKHNEDGKVIVSVLGITASELQKDGTYTSNFVGFREWLKSLDADGLNLLKPIAVWDVTFWDWSMVGTDEDLQLVATLHDLMFPKISNSWIDYANACGVDPLTLDTKLGRKWRNAHCDAQAAWACVKYDQDIFVTSNTKDFQKNISQLTKLGLKGVATPGEASKFLQ
jgi:hypothetical protein